MFDTYETSGEEERFLDEQNTTIARFADTGHPPPQTEEQAREAYRHGWEIHRRWKAQAVRRAQEAEAAVLAEWEVR